MKNRSRLTNELRETEEEVPITLPEPSDFGKSENCRIANMLQPNARLRIALVAAAEIGQLRERRHTALSFRGVDFRFDHRLICRSRAG